MSLGAAAKFFLELPPLKAQLQLDQTAREVLVARCLAHGHAEPDIHELLSSLEIRPHDVERSISEGRKRSRWQASPSAWTGTVGSRGAPLEAVLTPPRPLSEYDAAAAGGEAATVAPRAPDAADVEREAIATEPPATATPRGGRSARLPVIYAPDLAKPLPKFKWLSKPFGLIQGRVLAFTGYGDAGKTFAAMDLALAVASGAPKALGGLDVGLSGAVVHIDFEQQQQITAWRYQRLACGRGIDLAALGEKLGLVSLPPMNLVSPDAERELTALLHGKAFAIIDNLTAGAPGIDQNSAASAEPLYMLGRVSAATGCTIIVILHDNKTPLEGSKRPRAQQIRGSGAIHAALGGGLWFTKLDNGIITYGSVKETMGPKPEPEFFRIVDVGDIDPNTERTVGLQLEWIPPEQVACEDDAKAKALVARLCDFVGKHPGEATVAKLAREWSVRHEAMARAFKTAQSSGAIANQGSATRPNWMVAE